MLFNLLTEGRDNSVCHLNIYLIVGTIIIPILQVKKQTQKR